MVEAFKIAQVSEIVTGNCTGSENATTITQIAIDSRNLINPNSTLFVALKGAKFDGHDFIQELYKLGVRNFLVMRTFTIDKSLNAAFVQVQDTHQGLQQLATYQRKLFLGKVIGITGSNGKTIVKEWLGQVLSQHYSVVKSPKSYNSQVGVPLSVFGINSSYQVAILEAGISRPEEMEKLERIIQPNVGIFTNIGTAHEEGFENLDKKIAEKSQLFAGSDLIIYRKEHQEIHNHLRNMFPESRLLSWSEEVGADYLLKEKITPNGAKILFVKADSGMFTFQVPFSDMASLENIRHVIAASTVLGMAPHQIQEGISHLQAVDMRLTVKAGIRGCTLIDDTYNNDVAGLRLALDFMATQRPKKRKVLILSDLMQVGDSAKAYEEVGHLIKHFGIDRLIGVGTAIQQLADRFVSSSRYYQSTAELLLNLNEEQFDNDLVLITGARKFGFEVLVNQMQQRIHGTTLEINLNALTHNYNFYKSRLNPSTKVMVMVKAFAYGGGASEIANHVQHLQADYLAVAYTDEGVALREAGIHLPIMVLNPVQESFHLLQIHQLEPVVYSPSFFQQLGLYCQSQNNEMLVHLDLDTGMHRLGFEENHIQEVTDLIQEFPQLIIQSMYTHLVGADEEALGDFSLVQLELFKEMAFRIQEKLTYKPLLHALNSAGIIRFPDHQFDMVRLGIGLYGVEPSKLFSHQLKSISTLKTTISQIKTIKKGDTIGYGRKGKMAIEGRIATIAIGYADGYDRRFSNGIGKVLINRQEAKVIGNVCMDMTMVDITDLDAVEGDEVTIYGEGISLDDLAHSIGTISYELLTNISSRVKRVYYLD